MAEPVHKSPNRFHRTTLRQATFVLPRTGERVRRTFTLRDGPPNGHPPLDGSNDFENQESPERARSSHREAEAHSDDYRWVYLSKDTARRAWAFVTSPTGIGILKCSLAYLLGSLATFVAPIAATLGQQDGKHIVATITVYFHPARSIGSMYEATLLAVVAFLYAVFISFGSMATSIGFDNLGSKALGHALVLIVFCGGGLGLVGWLKQRLGSPLVNVACSLTSLAIITVLTKEGAVQTATFSYQKIFQVLKMVIMGVTITNFVSLLIRPVSARDQLRKTMIDATNSFGEMLALITRGFLYGSEEFMQSPAYVAASDQYRAVFISLTKQLNEAKYEHFVRGTKREFEIEQDMVKCMQRLAQHIGGLRSAAATQFTLLDEGEHGAASTPLTALYTPNSPHPISLTSSAFLPSQENFAVLTAIHEAPEEGSDAESQYHGARHSRLENQSQESQSTVHSPDDLFNRFIAQLGPSMKSLAYTLKKMLDELPYGPGPEFRVAVDPHFQTSLDEALALYGEARTEALSLLYRKKELTALKPTELAADFEEVAASCGHFSFSLQNFAEEMHTFLDILVSLQEETSREPRHRSWDWVFFWRGKRYAWDRSDERDPEHLNLINHQIVAELPLELRRSAARHTTHAKGSGKPSHREIIVRHIWFIVKFFRRDDVKFAIKVGAGAAIYALPSFLESTRPFYSHWRGEWGLLSYMLVCSMTIGASNTTGFSRFFGTCIGAVSAITAWFITAGNAYGLALYGWAMSLFCFYIIVAKGKGPMGRFILLTYNLSALYAYSLSVKDQDDDDDEGGIDPRMATIALHRVVAVMTGCIWGLFITRLFWPISARKKFKEGLGLLWLRMGLIWKRDPLSTLLEGESPNPYMDIGEEFELRSYLISLDGLRNSACSEFEFQGPFPDEAFQRILKSTGRMLDAFHAMKEVIIKDFKNSEGETSILRYTANERAQLSARISHLFQVLASSIKLEYPIDDAMPNTEHARDRLLAKTFDYRKRVRDAGTRSAEEKDFALLYAYALVTGQLSHELSIVEMEIEKLYGTLDEDLLKLQ